MPQENHTYMADLHKKSSHQAIQPTCVVTTDAMICILICYKQTPVSLVALCQMNRLPTTLYYNNTPSLTLLSLALYSLYYTRILITHK